MSKWLEWFKGRLSPSRFPMLIETSHAKLDKPRNIHYLDTYEQPITEIVAKKKRKPRWKAKGSIKWKAKLYE